MQRITLKIDFTGLRVGPNHECTLRVEMLHTQYLQHQVTSPYNIISFVCRSGACAWCGGVEPTGANVSFGLEMNFSFALQPPPPAAPRLHAWPAQTNFPLPRCLRLL